MDTQCVPLFFQGSEEVQVPAEPQAGVQFGARRPDDGVSDARLCTAALTVCW